MKFVDKKDIGSRVEVYSSIIPVGTGVSLIVSESILKMKNNPTILDRWREGLSFLMNISDPDDSRIKRLDDIQDPCNHEIFYTLEFNNNEATVRFFI